MPLYACLSIDSIIAELPSKIQHMEMHMDVWVLKLCNFPFVVINVYGIQNNIID